MIQTNLFYCHRKRIFYFKLFLITGEHQWSEEPTREIYIPKDPWDYREDPFSSFRSGFEIRTYRRCRRIMLFHCFKELPVSPYLVGTLDLHYDHTLQLGKTRR